MMHPEEVLCHTGKNKIHRPTFFFTFSDPYMIEKVLFLGQIFEMKILLDLHVLRAPESKNHIFSGWSVCVCVPSA